MPHQTDEVYTLHNSATRSSTPAASPIQSNGRRSIILIVDVTSITDTPTITPKITVYDEVTDSYYDYWEAGSGISATGTSVYVIGPGATDSPAAITESVELPLPAKIKVEITHSDSDDITYSVGYQLLL